MAMEPLTPIEQGDVDDIADLANLKLVPQDYERTDTVVGGTITGSFSFPAETTTTLRAWGDEMDRIWYSLREKNQDELNVSEYGAWGGPSGGYGITSTDRINEVLQHWWDVEGTGSYPVVWSCGPHLYVGTKAATIPQDTQVAVRACEQCKFLFSQMDAEPFTLRAGFIIGTIESPYEVTGAGISGLGTSASPHLVELDYDLYDGHLYGDVYFDWTAPGTNYPSDSDIGFSGWGTGASGVWEQLSGSSFRFHLGSVGIKSIIDNTGAGAQSGTLIFSCYVNDSGWTCTGFGIVGVVQFDTVASSTAGTPTWPVIHPRNAAMRSAFHLTSDIYFNDYASGLGDILDLEALVTKLQAVPPPDPPTGDPVSTFVYNSVDSGVKDLIDDYVHGVSDPVPIYDALVDFFNEKIDGTNLYDTGSWSGVTLRASTEWLLDLDPQDGLLLKILNRLLWEDAYPAELRRIPESDFAPEDEVGEIDVPDAVTDMDYYFSDFSIGAWMTLDSDENVSPVNRVAGIYVTRKAWPQAFLHTLLDQDLPQYYRAATEAGSSLRKAWDVSDTDGNVVGSVDVAGRNTMATWPVIKASDFGAVAYSSALAANGKGYAGGQERVGYWNADKHHTWVYQGDYNLPDGEVANYTVFVSDPASNALLEKKQIQVSGNNTAVTVYVGTDTPDPDDPGSYLFSRSDGKFTFPDDFTAESLDPADYYGTTLHFTFKNSSGSSKQLRIETSTFYSLDGEDPPLPEPLFFPRYSNDEEGRYRMALGRDSTSLLSSYSYRFTPFYESPGWSGETGRAMPVQDRGYAVVGLCIRKKPVMNEAGVYIPDTASGGTSVRIGIMAGTGVVAGAETGVYPGELIAFDDFSLGSGVPETVETVFWPVLEGCPLAYEDLSGEHIVTAYVCFQPGVNVEFMPLTIGTAPQQGTYSGRAYLQRHFLHGENFNVFNQFAAMVVPPVSVQSVVELDNLLTVQPSV